MKVIRAPARYEAKHQDSPPAQGTLNTFASVAASVQAEGSTTASPGLYLSTVLQSSQLPPALLTWVLSDLLQQHPN